MKDYNFFGSYLNCNELLLYYFVLVFGEYIFGWIMFRFEVIM